MKPPWKYLWMLVIMLTITLFAALSSNAQQAPTRRGVDIPVVHVSDEMLRDLRGISREYEYACVYANIDRTPAGYRPYPGRTYWRVVAFIEASSLEKCADAPGVVIFMEPGHSMEDAIEFGSRVYLENEGFSFVAAVIDWVPNMDQYNAMLPLVPLVNITITPTEWNCEHFKCDTAENRVGKST